MAVVVGSRRDLIFVISELYYEVGSRHFVIGGKITSCQQILTGLFNIVRKPQNTKKSVELNLYQRHLVYFSRVNFW